MPIMHGWPLNWTIRRCSIPDSSCSNIVPQRPRVKRACPLAALKAAAKGLPDLAIHLTEGSVMLLV
jgi:hypothetical protein